MMSQEEQPDDAPDYQLLDQLDQLDEFAGQSDMEQEDEEDEEDEEDKDDEEDNEPLELPAKWDKFPSPSVDTSGVVGSVIGHPWTNEAERGLREIQSLCTEVIGIAEQAAQSNGLTVEMDQLIKDKSERITETIHRYIVANSSRYIVVKEKVWGEFAKLDPPSPTPTVLLLLAVIVCSDLLATAPCLRLPSCISRRQEECRVLEVFLSRCWW